jgi:hypothetical protein
LSLLRIPQLRDVAETSIRELQGRVQDRDAALAALSEQLRDHQASYLAQHAKDRAEIEALSSKLYESGAASIAALKTDLERTTAALAATGDGTEQVRLRQSCLEMHQCKRSRM